MMIALILRIKTNPAQNRMAHKDMPTPKKELSRGCGYVEGGIGQIPRGNVETEAGLKKYSSVCNSLII